MESGMRWVTGRERCTGLRARAERFIARAAHLDPAERVLIEQVLSRGQSLRVLARETGAPPRNLHRRFRNILRRMSSPEYALLTRGFRGSLTPEQRRVGQLLFVRGLSQRTAAAQAGLSLHEV